MGQETARLSLTIEPTPGEFRRRMYSSVSPLVLIAKQYLCHDTVRIASRHTRNINCLYSNFEPVFPLRRRRISNWQLGRSVAE
jgi:hypothetical protein